MCFINFVTHVFLCLKVQFKYLQELLQPTLNYIPSCRWCLLTQMRTGLEPRSGHFASQGFWLQICFCCQFQYRYLIVVVCFIVSSCQRYRQYNQKCNQNRCSVQTSVRAGTEWRCQITALFNIPLSDELWGFVSDNRQGIEEIVFIFNNYSFLFSLSSYKLTFYCDFKNSKQFISCLQFSYFLKYIYQISTSFCFLLSTNILEMQVECKSFKDSSADRQVSGITIFPLIIFLAVLGTMLQQMGSLPFRTFNSHSIESRAVSVRGSTGRQGIWTDALSSFSRLLIFPQ